MPRAPIYSSFITTASALCLPVAAFATPDASTTPNLAVTAQKSVPAIVADKAGETDKASSDKDSTAVKDKDEEQHPLLDCGGEAEINYTNVTEKDAHNIDADKSVFLNCTRGNFILNASSRFGAITQNNQPMDVHVTSLVIGYESPAWDIKTGHFDFDLTPPSITGLSNTTINDHRLSSRTRDFSSSLASADFLGATLTHRLQADNNTTITVGVMVGQELQRQTNGLDYVFSIGAKKEGWVFGATLADRAGDQESRNEQSITFHLERIIQTSAHRIRFITEAGLAKNPIGYEDGTYKYALLSASDEITFNPRVSAYAALVGGMRTRTSDMLNIEGGIKYKLKEEGSFFAASFGKGLVRPSTEVNLVLHFSMP